MDRVKTPVFTQPSPYSLQEQGQVYRVAFLFYFSFLPPLLVRQGFKRNTDYGHGKPGPEKSPFLKGMEEGAGYIGYAFALLHSWACLLPTLMDRVYLPVCRGERGEVASVVS